MLCLKGRPKLHVFEDNGISIKSISLKIPHVLNKYMDAALSSNIMAENYKEGFLTRTET